MLVAIKSSYELFSFKILKPLVTYLQLLISSSDTKLMCYASRRQIGDAPPVSAIGPGKSCSLWTWRKRSWANFAFGFEMNSNFICNKLLQTCAFSRSSWSSARNFPLHFHGDSVQLRDTVSRRMMVWMLSCKLWQRVPWLPLFSKSVQATILHDMH